MEFFTKSSILLFLFTKNNIILTSLHTLDKNMQLYNILLLKGVLFHRNGIIDGAAGPGGYGIFPGMGIIRRMRKKICVLVKSAPPPLWPSSEKTLWGQGPDFFCFCFYKK